jgi:MATE family multidrug resistance protein
LAIVIAPVLTAIVWVVSGHMLRLGVRAELVARMVPYSHALVWGMLPLLLYFVFRRYLQAINQVVPVMFALLSANVVNLAGDWALIYGHWGFRARGVTGSGWSTAIALTYMAVVLMAYTVYYDNRYKTGLRAASMQMDIARIRRILRLGFPAASQIMVEIGLFAVVTSLIGRLGPLPLASHLIALNTISVVYMVPLGIASAAAVRVGQALGRDDPDGARHSGWTAISMGAAFMSCVAIVFWTEPRVVVRLFTPDEAVIHAAARLLFVAAFFQLFDGVQTVATGALRGTGDTRTPLMAHLIAYWVIGLPLGYFLCFDRGMGAIGLWLGISAALMSIGVALLAAWMRTVRRLGAGLR